jgi:hypothetical protein
MTKVMSIIQLCVSGITYLWAFFVIMGNSGSEPSGALFYFSWLALTVVKFLFWYFCATPKRTPQEIERDIANNRYLAANRMIPYETYAAKEQSLMRELAAAKAEQTEVTGSRLDNYQIQVLYRLRTQNMMTDAEYNYFISRR